MSDPATVDGVLAEIEERNGLRGPVGVTMIGGDPIYINPRNTDFGRLVAALRAAIHHLDRIQANYTPVSEAMDAEAAILAALRGGTDAGKE